jgi:hypothetical protein
VALSAPGLIFSVWKLLYRIGVGNQILYQVSKTDPKYSFAQVHVILIAFVAVDRRRCRT